MPVWVSISILTLLLIAAVIDLRSREVPDWIPIVLLGLGSAATGFGWTEIGWVQLAGGVVLGFVLSAILFALGGIGGGDVKLRAALGALLGPWGWIQAMVWIGLAGGVLALVSLWRADQGVYPSINVS